MFDTTLTLENLGAMAWFAVGLAHSLLGEKFIVRPLFAEPSWRLGKMPREASEVLLRFAWHATTFAWFGIGAILLGAPALTVAMIVALLSGVIDFWWLRWHLAWPVFLLAAIGAASGAGWLEPVTTTISLAVIVTLGVLGLVHVYWAFGGRAGADVAIPSKDHGEPLFRPGPWLTMAVALALFAYAAVVAVAITSGSTWARGLVVAAVAVLTLRAVGDGRYVGFTKQIRNTTFARLDDRLYTPIVVFLGLASAIAVAG